MYSTLIQNIEFIYDKIQLSNQRKENLLPLIDSIQNKVEKNEVININFICTHNSRRSHLAQIWAQIASSYYKIPNIHCFSGGTEETALFPKVIEVLTQQGLHIFKISKGKNPVYAVRYKDTELPIIGFSKKYGHPFNPVSGFIAVMTCSQADGDCPFVTGAESRISIPYKDPKESDGKKNQQEVYYNRSLEIAQEMFYVFSQIKI